MLTRKTTGLGVQQPADVPLLPVVGSVTRRWRRTRPRRPSLTCRRRSTRGCRLRPCPCRFRPDRDPGGQQPAASRDSRPQQLAPPGLAKDIAADLDPVAVQQHSHHGGTHTRSPASALSAPVAIGEPQVAHVVCEPGHAGTARPGTQQASRDHQRTGEGLDRSHEDVEEHRRGHRADVHRSLHEVSTLTHRLPVSRPFEGCLSAADMLVRSPGLPGWSPSPSGCDDRSCHLPAGDDHQVTCSM